ncbi:tyrosine-type recombinase/integrase [Streptosporangium roseum]|uniref:tyrosine-type recombinase/integrase n=1 Tax=Streptosporangium roseum TaxID=2001 RepID=UPI00331F99D2
MRSQPSPKVSHPRSTGCVRPEAADTRQVSAVNCFPRGPGRSCTALTCSEGAQRTIRFRCSSDPDPTTAHVLRHTLATTLVRGKTDLVLVAEILGHARLETTRRYSLPSDKDKEDALNLITVDR